jgi:hypothetical protein
MINRADQDDPPCAVPRKGTRPALVSLMAGVAVVLGLAAPAQARVNLWA